MSMPEMCQGSHGPMVVAVVNWFHGWTRARYPGFLPDRKFGAPAAAIVRAFQRSFELPETGNVDHATMARVEEDFNLSFEAMARSIGGQTTFVQSDGSEIAWPEPPIEEPLSASQRLRLRDRCTDGW